MAADNNTILDLPKVDLGISGTAYDSRLTSLIEAAKEYNLKYASHQP